MSGAIHAQALGDLMDDEPGGLAEIVVQLEHDLEQKDELARRLLDQVRYQHTVLTEIYGLSDDGCVVDSRRMYSIRVRSGAAIRSVAKSGLLA